MPKYIKDIGINENSPNFFKGDDVLKREGFQRLSKYLNDNDIKEISVIGGSHSGFSCVWLMLNGNASFGHNKKEKISLHTARKFATACCEFQKNCICL